MGIICSVLRDKIVGFEDLYVSVSGKIDGGGGLGGFNPPGKLMTPSGCPLKKWWGGGQFLTLLDISEMKSSLKNFKHCCIFALAALN